MAVEARVWSDAEKRVVYIRTKSVEAKITYFMRINNAADMAMLLDKGSFGFERRDIVAREKLEDPVLEEMFLAVQKSGETPEAAVDAAEEMFLAVQKSGETPEAAVDAAKARGLIKKYKAFQADHGITAAALARVVNGRLYSTWVEPIKGVAYKYAFWGGRYNTEVLHRVWDCLPMLEQIQKDGIEHVAPICLLLGKDPQTAKRTLGKGLWKRLCAQSKTRNTLIMKRLVPFLAMDKHDPQNWSELIGISCEIPSGFLKRNWLSIIPGADKRKLIIELQLIKLRQELEALLQPKLLEGQAKRKNPLLLGAFRTGAHGNVFRPLRTAIHLIEDTLRLEETLGIEHKSPATIKGWKKRHDKLAKDSIGLNYSDKPIYALAEWPETISFPERFTHSLRLLRSSREIAEHARQMSHCAAAYIADVYKGSYVLYEILNENLEVVGTLGGIKVVGVVRPADRGPSEPVFRENDVWQVQQAYGRFNSKLSPLADLEAHALFELESVNHK